jgi:hypothetical protein
MDRFELIIRRHDPVQSGSKEPTRSDQVVRDIHFRLMYYEPNLSSWSGCSTESVQEMRMILWISVQRSMLIARIARYSTFYFRDLS